MILIICSSNQHTTFLAKILTIVQDVIVSNLWMSTEIKLMNNFRGKHLTCRRKMMLKDKRVSVILMKVLKKILPNTNITYRQVHSTIKNIYTALKKKTIFPSIMKFGFLLKIIF